MGYPVTVYKTDQLLNGNDNFNLELSSEVTLNITYNGQSLLAEDLGSAWYRKVGSFALADSEDQLAKQLYMNNEVRSLHETIWTLYPDELWLSSPANITAADRKLAQLITAKEVGFNIPETLISSHWGQIKEFINDNKRGVIVKMIRGVISDGNQIKAMYTTQLNSQLIEEIEPYTSPFPGIYQHFIEKAREWRVTVIDSDIFPVAIYTTEAAKDDWRKHQLSGDVEFKNESLPAKVGDLCLDYLAKSRLRFGAFDLVEQSDGQIVFLECNPNGQYGWLEEALELPITKSIASALIRIQS